MSHFAKLSKANIVDANAFIAAMKELGLTEVEKNTTIRPWDGADKPEEVDVFCRLPGTRTPNARHSSNPADYGIAIKKNGSKFEMLSDWSLTGYYLPQKVKATIPGHTSFYAKDGPGGGAYAACEALRGLALGLTTKHTIVSAYRKQGFMANVKVNADRSINVTLTR